MYIFISSIFMFIMSFLSLGFKKNHLMSLLVLLEFMAVTILLMLMNFLCEVSCDVYMLIYIIITLVCEAVMGLILLTLFVRCHGSDYFQVSSVFSC